MKDARETSIKHQAVRVATYRSPDRSIVAAHEIARGSRPRRGAPGECVHYTCNFDITPVDEEIGGAAT